MDFVPPKATRFSDAQTRRLENQAMAAYDRYLMEMERARARILRLKAEATVRQMEERKSEVAADDEIGTLYASYTGMVGERESWSLSVSSGKTVEPALCGKLCPKLLTTNVISYRTRWWQFFSIIYYLTCSPWFLIVCVEHCLKWGALLAVLSIVVMQILICSPLFFAYTFMASYSRRSYVRFWDCVPVVKGLGYSMVITSMVIELFNVPIAAALLHYVFTTITWGTIPWEKCSFPRADPFCMPIPTNESETIGYNSTCCPVNECGKTMSANQSAKFAASDYFMSFVLYRGFGDQAIEEGPVVWWVVVVVLLWAIIGVFVTVGVKSFHRAIGIVHLIVIIACLPAIIAVIVHAKNYETVSQLESNFENLLKSEFWIDFLTLNLYSGLPSDIIPTSARSVPMVNRPIDTVLVFTMKVCSLTMIIVIMCICAREVQILYKISDSNCVFISGTHFIFVLIPEILATHFPLPVISLLSYFTVTFLWCINVSICVVNNAVEAVLDEFPLMMRFRLPIGIICCTILAATNAIMITPYFPENSFAMLMDSFPTVVSFQVITTWIGFVLYSLRTFVDDYHYSFATKLSVAWVIGLKCGMMLIFVFLFLLWSTHALSRGNLIIYCVLLGPIPAGAVLVTVRHYMNLHGTVLDPNPTWGPPTKRRRLERALFDSAHDLRYRSTAENCKHHCLLRSQALKREVLHWRTRLDTTATMVNATRRVSSLDIYGNPQIGRRASKLPMLKSDLYF